MELKSHSKLYFGVADATIAAVLRTAPELFDGFGVLLRTLDSESDLARAAGTVIGDPERAAGVKLIGPAIWIPPRAALAVLRKPSLLTHFDELYVVDQVEARDWPDLGVYTPDRVLFNETIPSEFYNGFIALGARSYFADGTGLNYALTRLQDCEGLVRAEGRKKQDRRGGEKGDARRPS